MAELKINADLTEAIELLAQKLGLAATEIIPAYARMIFISGISNCIAGLLCIILPFFLFAIKLPIPTTGYSTYDLISTPEGYKLMFIVLGIGIVIVFVCIGISLIADSMEKIFATKGKAISRLLNQIT